VAHGKTLILKKTKFASIEDPFTSIDITKELGSWDFRLTSLIPNEKKGYRTEIRNPLPNFLKNPNFCKLRPFALYIHQDSNLNFFMKDLSWELIKASHKDMWGIKH